ncbi:hypothetical protein AB0G60_02600 [Streptomyces angustmyceticus]|uniref:Uncharacterized protein n=1 Tax=Streptomyces angustmyceticus TaxID=285578 RepID=A0A5J4LBB2_9ACTN|nr:hypothetical protein [Streptomyces angustmyceticus]UAL65553.1 hypothetical protein K7396_02575 [Streptomyces angustmyceticus]GES27928.1 hypothetical protein San01_04150 [Streptomyces angustmyceticus]
MATSPQRPDYQCIAQLERELGMGKRQSERGIRPNPVCLVKNCAADTTELRTWSGQLIRRVYQH